jgi:hypothetical protein
MLDADRLKDLFVALVREVVATTRESGADARAIAVCSEIDERCGFVVEIADVRRVYGADADDDAEAWLSADESNARATDAATGIVLSTTRHAALGRIARVEIPAARLDRS